MTGGAHQNLPVGTPQIVISDAATIAARYPLLRLPSARASSTWALVISFARASAIMGMGFRMSVTLSSNLGISHIFDRISLSLSWGQCLSLGAISLVNRGFWVMTVSHLLPK